MALPALAPILLAVIIAAVFRLLVALGIGFLTFTVALPSFYSWIQGFFSGLPIEILQVVGLLRVDIAITMLLSAAAARVIYKISAAPLISLGG